MAVTFSARWDLGSGGLRDNDRTTRRLMMVSRSFTILIIFVIITVGGSSEFYILFLAKIP